MVKFSSPFLQFSRKIVQVCCDRSGNFVISPHMPGFNLFGSNVNRIEPGTYCPCDRNRRRIAGNTLHLQCLRELDTDVSNIRFNLLLPGHGDIRNTGGKNRPRPGPVQDILDLTQDPVDMLTGNPKAALLVLVQASVTWRQYHSHRMNAFLPA